MRYSDVLSVFKKIKNRFYSYKTKFNRNRRWNNYRRTIDNFLKKNSKISKNSNLILIWELGGFAGILSKNSIFSLGLNVRGYKTCFIICDGSCLACIQRGLEKNEKISEWDKKCKECCENVVEMARKCNVDYVLGSRFINDKKLNEFKLLSESLDIKKIEHFEFLGVPVGTLAWSSTIRYMKGFLIDIDQMTLAQQEVYRKYFYAALVNTYIASKVLEKLKPQCLLVSHGVYVDYAPPLIIARNNGLKVLSWSSGFAKFYHYFLAPKRVASLKPRETNKTSCETKTQKSLNQIKNDRLDKFIQARYFSGAARDLSILSKPQSGNELKEMLKIYNDDPIVVLFAHVNWDYCFDLSGMIFDSPNQWVIESVQRMMKIKNINWLIKIHPGEIIDGSLLSTEDLLNERFDTLPSHIKIVKPDSSINSYGLYQLIDVGITILGTVGVEIPLFGKPIIAAGDAHFSGKGFSLDPKNQEEYFMLLENIKDIKPLTPEQIKLARQYAYSYFIERQIPLNIIDRKQGHWGDLDLNRLDELLPGNDPVLDKICESILNGKAVILDEKELEFIDKKNRELNSYKESGKNA
jgi:hypothetical protein